MMRGAVIAAMVATLALAGCAGGVRNALKPSGSRALFDGKYYPARLTRDRDDRAAFSVTVSRVAQGTDGAREAGRYEATKYCIAQYGNSDATWTIGPDTETLTARDDQITFTGRCAG